MPPSEKNWEPHSATGRGNSNTLHSSDTSMLFPVLQICLPMHPHPDPTWEAKAGSQCDCHSLREITAKMSPELRFLNCFLHCYQSLLFKQDLPRLQILTKRINLNDEIGKNRNCTNLIKHKAVPLHRQMRSQV